VKVLVVIPCLNEAENLPRLLSWLLASDLVGKLVVADGGSWDASRDIIRQAAAADSRVVLLANPHRIQSTGVNLAVEQFGQDYRYFVRVDAHCAYPANYLEGLVDAASRMHASSIVVPMVTRGESGFQLAVAAAQNSKLGTGGSPHRSIGEGAFVDHGHHALMETGMFRAAGGYCEAMPANEDAELDWRLRRAGHRIWLEPQCAITYFPRSTPRSLWRQYQAYGAGRAETFLRHGTPLKPRQVLPLMVPVAVLLALLAPFNIIFAVPLALWVGICLIGGVLLGLALRERWALAAGVAAMIMHLAWGVGFLRRVILDGRPAEPQLGFCKMPSGREPEHRR